MKIIFFFAGLLLSLQVIAQPDFTTTYDDNIIKLYRDVKQTDIFYYLPGKISLGYDASGKPDLTFLMMRYTGTSVYNDQQQKIRHRNILTMRMILQPPPQAELAAAKKMIERRTGRCELRPLPLNKLEAMLIFTPLNAQKDSAIVEIG